MKYCLNYAKSSRALKRDAAEINILYDKNDEALPSFIENNPDKRINLVFTKPEDAFDTIEIKKLQAIAEKYPTARLHLCLYPAKKMEELNLSLIARVKSTNLPWFTGNIATTWDAVMYLINLGVSDIYVGEDLGFELPAVHRTCKNNNISLRLFPNVAQSSISSTPPLKKFFIRPEDLKVYEPYIDTLEFWGDLSKQDIVYNVYKHGKWAGKLGMIILDLDTDMDSYRTLPIFGTARLHCNKKCLRNSLNCVICDNVYNLSKKLQSPILKTKNHD